MTQELSKFYIEKAKNELGETESRKEQSIRQFKEWLSKHPFIKYPEIEDETIIKFLRARKYSMPKVFESFEEILYFFKKLQPFVKMIPADEARLIDIYNKGAYCSMINCDTTGAHVLLVRFKVFEDLQTNHNDLFRLQNSFAIALESDPKIQIAGTKVILDFRGTSLNILKILPIKMIFESAQFNEYFPLKIKNVFYIGLPTFGVNIFNSFKSIFKKKIQDRVICLNNENELLKYFEPNVLLEEFGGSLKNDECLEYFYQRFLDGIKNLRNLNFEFNEKIFIEMRHKNDSKFFEDHGSFRKLEID